VSFLKPANILKSVAAVATNQVLKEAEKNVAAVAGLFSQQRQPYVNPSPQSSVYIRHVKSGKFVHPQDFRACSDAALVMYQPCRPAVKYCNNEDRYAGAVGLSGLFTFGADGNLRHEQSGLFVHVQGVTAPHP
jgi:hypothetical protein